MEVKGCYACYDSWTLTITSEAPAPYAGPNMSTNTSIVGGMRSRFAIAHLVMKGFKKLEIVSELTL